MQNPFHFGEPVPPSRMIGRWYLVEEVTSELTNPGGHSYMIVAGRRFGKSSFLKALEDTLTRQCEQRRPGDKYFVPILVNLDSLENRSARGVFDFFLMILYKCFKSDTNRETSGISFSIGLESTMLHAYMVRRSEQKACTLEEFTEILRDLCKVFLDYYSSDLCFIYLLDEIEKILGKDWTEVLFDHLRSLIYDGPLVENIRYVIVGSSKVVEVKQDDGSPLLNMLNVKHLNVLNDQDIQKIINLANNVPADVSSTVLEYCGGHPFIAQYLMYQLWKKDLAKTTRAMIEKELFYQFISERIEDLKTWWKEIGEAGQKTYAVLAEANCWLDIKEVRKRVNTPRLDTQRWLDRLCYHGLAQRDDTWRYHCTGLLFKKWFEENALPVSSIDTNSTSATRSIEIFYVYALEDKDMLSELEKHLAGMKNRGLITDWHNARILAGRDIMRENEQHWNSARIILLLISPGFMSSEVAYKEHHSENFRCCHRMVNRLLAGTLPTLLLRMSWKVFKKSLMTCGPVSSFL